MDATMRAKALNDDAGAALRRAIGFAALFSLAGVASMACTARAPDRMGIAATDRLLAEQARLTAQVQHADAIVFPATLLARRADPGVASALEGAQRRFVAERSAAAARRDAIVEKIETTRAERDLFEARRTVLRVKADMLMERQAAARAANDRAALASAAAEVRTLQAQAMAANEGATRTGTRLNQLVRGIAVLAQASHARAAQQLAQVQQRLRGA